MRDDLQAAATEVKNSEVFRCSRYGARNNTTQAAPMPSVKHLHLIREIVVSMMVPGVGVEPTQARGPRDFKAPGRGQRTKDSAIRCPLSVSEESEEGRRVRGLWTPRWIPVPGSMDSSVIVPVLERTIPRDVAPAVGKTARKHRAPPSQCLIQA